MKHFPSPDQVIFSTKATSGKIYIREQKGVFQQRRRILSWVLMSLFTLLPWINFHGQQAFRIDAPQMRIELFSLILFPQDLLILALLFTLSAFALFYITKLYGRVWCGYTCPQTIWTLMFVWLERRIEGSNSQSKALDNAPWSSGKVLKKSLKHISWLAVSVLTALIFISYFVPARQLYSEFFTLQSSAAIYNWVLLFASCTYVNAGLVREKMCLHMCPYARFQSAMFDPATSIVTYDAARGEHRGPRKRHAEKTANAGDCVDCNLCVQVCPVGIDIRDGMQYECINCGLCIDACDQTMQHFGYDKRLIKYQAEQADNSGWKRHAGYGMALILTITAMAGWAYQRENTEFTVIRDRNALYRINSNDQLENTFTLNIINKTQKAREYQLHVIGLPHNTVIGNQQFNVGPGEQQQFVISIATDSPPEGWYSKFELQLEDKHSGKKVSDSTRFYGQALHASRYESQ